MDGRFVWFGTIFTLHRHVSSLQQTEEPGRELCKVLNMRGKERARISCRVKLPLWNRNISLAYFPCELACYFLQLTSLHQMQHELKPLCQCSSLLLLAAELKHAVDGHPASLVRGLNNFSGDPLLVLGSSDLNGNNQKGMMTWKKGGRGVCSLSKYCFLI